MEAQSWRPIWEAHFGDHFDHFGAHSFAHSFAHAFAHSFALSFAHFVAFSTSHSSHLFHTALSILSNEQAHRREERRLRDAFRALLAEKHAAGVFHAKSKWADVEVLIAKEPAFESCLKQSGSAPHELWEDYMEILNEAWQAQRRTLKAVLLAVGAAFTVTPETGFDAFAAALREADSGTLEEVPESAIRAFLIELQEKQLKELADAERKLAQQRKEKLEKYGFGKLVQPIMDAGGYAAVSKALGVAVSKPRAPPVPSEDVVREGPQRGVSLGGSIEEKMAEIGKLKQFQHQKRKK